MRITSLIVLFILPLIFFYFLSLEKNHSIKIFYWVWAGRELIFKIQNIRKFYYYPNL